eukprot:TRINITY_DN12421_c0_g1_i1.p1 TRINITY_DN12421_c0_g1~~TRINITY_DN12421_c0_g1_i1.p1  ORF type:complete len:684 (+),score=129.28 TRINITY_DN12421_c0_g1_i1:69-2120(+)
MKPERKVRPEEGTKPRSHSHRERNLNYECLLNSLKFLKTLDNSSIHDTVKSLNTELNPTSKLSPKGWTLVGKLVSFRHSIVRTECVWILLSLWSANEDVIGQLGWNAVLSVVKANPTGALLAGVISLDETYGNQMVEETYCQVLDWASSDCQDFITELVICLGYMALNSRGCMNLMKNNVVNIIAKCLQQSSPLLTKYVIILIQNLSLSPHPRVLATLRKAQLVEFLISSLNSGKLDEETIDASCNALANLATPLPSIYEIIESWFEGNNLKRVSNALYALMIIGSSNPGHVNKHAPHLISLVKTFTTSEASGKFPGSLCEEAQSAIQILSVPPSGSNHGGGSGGADLPGTPWDRPSINLQKPLSDSVSSELSSGGLASHLSSPPSDLPPPGPWVGDMPSCPPDLPPPGPSIDHPSSPPSDLPSGPVISHISSPPLDLPPHGPSIGPPSDLPPLGPPITHPSIPPTDLPPPGPLIGYPSNPPSDLPPTGPLVSVLSTPPSDLPPPGPFGPLSSLSPESPNSLLPPSDLPPVGPSVSAINLSSLLSSLTTEPSVEKMDTFIHNVEGNDSKLNADAIDSLLQLASNTEGELQQKIIIFLSNLAQKNTWIQYELLKNRALEFAARNYEISPKSSELVVNSIRLVGSMCKDNPAIQEIVGEQHKPTFNFIKSLYGVFFFHALPLFLC